MMQQEQECEFGQKSPKAGHIQMSAYTVRSIILDGICPFLVYEIARRFTSESLAVLLTTLPPLASLVLAWRKKKRIDIFGIIVIVGLLGGLAIYLLGGPARLILVRNKIIVGLTGLLFLASIPFPKPMVYYVARELEVGHASDERERWERCYKKSPTKFGVRVMTLGWGLALLGECGIQLALGFTIPIWLWLILSPIIGVIFYWSMFSWSFKYFRKSIERDMDESSKKKPAAGGPPKPAPGSQPRSREA